MGAPVARTDTADNLFVVQPSARRVNDILTAHSTRGPAYLRHVALLI